MKPSRLLPLLLALLKFVSGYLLASRAYELHRDEYLYLNYGRHLAWGYLEVPPLTALLETAPRNRKVLHSVSTCRRAVNRPETFPETRARRGFRRSKKPSGAVCAGS